MPLYIYECEKCGTVGEFITGMEEYQKCPECKTTMKRLPTPFNINMGPVPTGGYYDDNLESYIQTNEQRKRLMREKGITEHGATPKEGVAWV